MSHAPFTAVSAPPHTERNTHLNNLKTIRVFCEFQDKKPNFAPSKQETMEIKFEEDYLREIYYEGKAHNKKYRFQPQIIKKFIRVIDLMASLNRIEDFYRYKTLHYETLVGDKKDRESVKVNDQYRIEFRSEIIGDEEQITICNILELSNHYK